MLPSSGKKGLGEALRAPLCSLRSSNPLARVRPMRATNVSQHGRLSENGREGEDMLHCRPVAGSGHDP